MADSVNTRRADNAIRAIDAYAGAEHEPQWVDQIVDQMQDLLSDLRHLAARMGIDFDDIDERAANRFAEEIE